MIIQPKRSVSNSADVRMKESGGTDEIKLDVTNDVITTDDNHTGRLKATMIENVRLIELIEPN